ncbi:MAG: hypothetical protein WCJ66_05375 [Verrucomicrobiota bacterium]
MKAQVIDSRPRGFALVITLALMVLLTLLVVGLLGLSSISLRDASQSEAMATARNNARLAMMLAIGQLQKSLGPDKAVTAPSEILASHPAKPNTVGVWDSWDFNPNSSSLDYAGEKATRFRRWLVSSADPAAATSRNFGAAEWTGDTIELVGNGSLGDNAEAAAKVVAGKVPISRAGKSQGALAWHVADESAKARINLYRDPSLNTTLAQQRALLAGHRPDPSVIKSPTSGQLSFLPKDDTAAHFTVAGTSIPKITDLDQVSLLADAKGKIKAFRNDVTPYSLGLMTDVRNGGLKQDLSSVFEMNASLPTAFANKKLYQSTHGITGVSDPYWSTLSGYYNSFRSITNPETNPTFSQAPSQAVTLTNLAAPTHFSAGPVIAKVEMLFSFVTRDSHGCWISAFKSVDPQLICEGHLIYTPLITLHNPYNVNISFDSMEVTFRNVPAAFKFYINGVAQTPGLLPVSEMYVNNTALTGKSFDLKIANWGSPSASSPTGAITMKPGQTLVCGPYLDPAACFNDDRGTPFFDYDNNTTGYTMINGQPSIVAIKAKPGFVGRAFGFDIDWIAPPNNPSNQGNWGMLSLKPTDTLHMEYGIRQPTYGVNTTFDVTAKLTSNNKTLDYGGLNFQYQDAATLGKLFPKTYRYPSSGEFNVKDAYVSNSTPLASHALVKTVAVFSAYARTTNGGVYETGKRTETAGSLNELKDGRLAGKPFLFNNPARTVVSVDLRKEKPGAHSHELNFQEFMSAGAFEDYFTVDSTNRTPYLTGNTTSHGLKSGSYLELPVGPLQTIADFRRSNALTSFFLPNFVQPVANSMVSPLMSTDKVSQIDANVATYAMLDHSVLANHALYDRFYFSTFATSGKANPDTVFSEFMAGKRALAAQAFQPYLPHGKSAEEAKTELFAAGQPRDTAYQMAAEYQMLRGPFNVNSMSVQAWKGMLATLNKGQLVTLWAKSGLLASKAATGILIPGMSLLNGGGSNARIDTKNIDDTKTNEWNGCHELTESQIEQLATNIVEQVRLRGPFLSLSEFVNRRIGTESEMTRSGALETAIAKSKVNDTVFVSQIPINVADVTNATLYNYKTPMAATGNPAAGAPGWIGQGDLMRLLEPAATVRGDTFVIRVCGEACDAKGVVTARAYAEAVVQRMPEYVNPVDRPSLNVYTDAKAAPANRSFGRRINVVSFRWLASHEV